MIEPEDMLAGMSSMSSETPRGSSYMEPQPNGIPPWVQFILDEMNRQFKQTNDRIDKLVTQQEFRDEKSRVSDSLRELGKDVAKNTADIQAEATARMNSEVARSQKDSDEVKRAQATERQTKWQWIGIVGGPIATVIVMWIANGGLTTP